MYALPAYNERGLDVVNNAGGILWSSPEFVTGDVFSRDGGEKIGDAQLLAITLTPRPAQSNNKIDRVTLTERLEMNIDDMSIDELKKALSAKDELTKELESKIREMKDEAESSMMSYQKDDEKSKLAEDDDDEKSKLAEDDDDEKKKLAEDDDEKKKVSAMSETLTETTLLSEVVSLRESNFRLNERVEALENEKRSIEKREQVNILLREGRITPDESDVVGKAFELKDIQPEFWKMFSERPKNSAVSFETIGHGASGQEITKKTLDIEVKKIVTDKNVQYSEALSMFRNENPDYYSKVFGA